MFKTYLNNKEVKEREFYLWNIEPNSNENSSDFINKLIYKIFRENEALIFTHGTGIYIADSFNKRENIKGNIYFDITLGDFELRKIRKENEVMYFKNSFEDVYEIVSGISESYSRLIKTGMESFEKDRGSKAIFKYDSLPVAGTDEREMFDKLINTNLKTFLESKNAVAPFGKGQDLTEFGSKTGGYKKDNSRDIKEMINDIFDFTARAFSLPKSLITGEVQDTEKAVEQLISLCIEPLLINLEGEINRKRNGYLGFEQGNFLKIDTKNIKYKDVLSLASSIDKLISSGVFNINDIRRLCNEEAINEPWAEEHFITKNYDKITNIKNEEKGAKNEE